MHLHADEVGLAIGAARAGRPELGCRAVWERDALLPLVRCAILRSPLLRHQWDIRQYRAISATDQMTWSCRCVNNDGRSTTERHLVGVEILILAWSNRRQAINAGNRAGDLPPPRDTCRATCSPSRQDLEDGHRRGRDETGRVGGRVHARLCLLHRPSRPEDRVLPRDQNELPDVSADPLLNQLATVGP